MNAARTWGMVLGSGRQDGISVWYLTRWAWCWWLKPARPLLPTRPSCVHRLLHFGPCVLCHSLGWSCTRVLSRCAHKSRRQLRNRPDSGSRGSSTAAIVSFIRINRSGIASSLVAVCGTYVFELFILSCWWWLEKPGLFPFRYACRQDQVWAHLFARLSLTTHKRIRALHRLISRFYLYVRHWTIYD